MNRLCAGWNKKYLYTTFSKKWDVFALQKKSFSDARTKTKDLYSVLCVNPKATQTEIKDSYYDLSLKFHPDRNEGSADAARRFHEITEAYQVLGNYFLRRRYDRGLPLALAEVPLPTAADLRPEEHRVKYQTFFDSRTLPYRMSAARTAETEERYKYKMVQPGEQPEKFAEIDKILNDPEEVRIRQNCGVLGVLMVLFISYFYKKEMGYNEHRLQPCGMEMH